MEGGQIKRGGTERKKRVNANNMRERRVLYADDINDMAQVLTYL